MRIVHLLTTNLFSGAESVACKIIDIYKKDEAIEMVYCCPSGPIEKILSDRGIVCYPMASFSLRNVKKALKELKPDLVHAHDFRASFFMSLLAKKYPFVSHIHNNAPWIKEKGILSRLFLHAAKKAKKVIAVSDSIVNEYVFGQAIKNKCITMANPIDLVDIRSKSIQEKMDEKFDVIFCGRMSKEKRPLLFLDLMIELLKKEPNLNIAMVGSGPMDNEIREAIEEKNMNQIKFFGFLANPYVAMKNSKIICIPSEFEGFGLVAVEAMCLGLPIVCSGAGGLSSIVTANTGFICNNIGEYLNAFETLSDNVVYRKYSNDCIKESERFDNLIEYKNQLDKIYKE